MTFVFVFCLKFTTSVQRIWETHDKNWVEKFVFVVFIIPFPPFHFYFIGSSSVSRGTGGPQQVKPVATHHLLRRNCVDYPESILR